MTGLNSTQPDKRAILFASLPILFTVGLLTYQILVIGGAPHIPLILGLAAAAIAGMVNGISWPEIQTGIVNSVSKAVPVIGIFMLVGMTIGTWILSGTVPFLVSLGMGILSAQTFLPLTCLVCAIISVCTGTSWGTLGTIGLALMGVGEAVSVPSYITAGAIVSGAWFGDKMSPLSDTTNFAAAIAGVSLYDHIRGMLPTTIPSILLALLCYFIIGTQVTIDLFDTDLVTGLDQILNTVFRLNLLVLLPPLVVLASVFGKVPPMPGIFMGVIAAACVAYFVQGSSIQEISTVMMSGYQSETGTPAIDRLLSKGGLTSMMWVISLVMIALAFGGVLEKTRALQTVLAGLVPHLNTRFKLVLGTLLMTFGLNLSSNAFVAYTVPGNMFSPLFRGQRLSGMNLSRLLEDGATMTAPLIPWNSGAVYVSGTLGVPTLLYAPFAFANWIAPLFDLVWGLTGAFIPAASDEEVRMWIETEAPVWIDGDTKPAGQFFTQP